MLKPDGVLLANLILDGRLETPYARNLLATIDSVFGRCAVDVLHKAKTQSNVEVICFASSRPAATGAFTSTRRTAPTWTWRARASGQPQNLDCVDQPISLRLTAEYPRLDHAVTGNTRPQPAVHRFHKPAI